MLTYVLTDVLTDMLNMLTYVLTVMLTVLIEVLLCVWQVGTVTPIEDFQDLISSVDVLTDVLMC